MGLGHAMVWKSQETCWSQFSFYLVVSQDSAQVVRLGDRHLCLLSHLTSCIVCISPDYIKAVVSLVCANIETEACNQPRAQDEVLEALETADHFIHTPAVALQ